MNNKNKEEKIKEILEELEVHQSHDNKTDSAIQSEKKDGENTKVDNQNPETEQLELEKEDEKDKSEEVAECKKRNCRDVRTERDSLKKEVTKIKQLHIGEVFNRMYIMKQIVAMWMNCYGQNIMKEVFDQMKNEMEAINKGDYKTLADEKGNPIDCFGCKKPIVTWPGLENKASDGNDYCFGCFNNKFPDEWKQKISAYQESEVKKQQAMRNEKHENLAEHKKFIELKLNGQTALGFYTKHKEEKYKISDVRISWDENKYNVVLGTNSAIVDKIKTEGKEEEKTFLLEIFENGNLVDNRRISATKEQKNEVASTENESEISKEEKSEESDSKDSTN